MVQPARFQSLQTEMEGRLFERREEIEGLILAVLSRQHILLVGPKGAAKSMMIRMLAGSIQGAHYFERLLTRFTLPDELFGPVSISALKQDRFSRITRGYLPEAHFAFLDELWKANSSILNSLLAIINERLFYNAGEVSQCPLETMMGPSAELPQEEALSALYDRFLLRYRVEYIAEDGHLLEMMADNRPPVLTSRITLDEIHAARDAVAAVEFDRPLLESIAKIRRQLEAEGLTLSDRRYKESLSIVRAKAWLQGRAYAVEDDLAVLANVLWDDPASEPMVRGLVLDVANPHDKRAREIMDALQVALTNLQGLDDPRERTMAAGLRLLLAESQIPLAQELAFDLFCSLYKYFVKLRSPAEIAPECQGHRDLLGRALELREHEKLRAFTRLKPAETALATELVLDALLQEIARVPSASEDAGAAEEARDSSSESVGSVTTQRLREVMKDAREDLQSVTELIAAWSSGPGQETRLPVELKLRLMRDVVRNPRLRMIALLFGRYRRLGLRERTLPAMRASQEVVDFIQGGDVARALAGELSSFAMEEREDLFYAKVVTHSLLIYELWRREEEPRAVYLCIDNSGSMAGEKEVWAKASALALAHLALAEDRPVEVVLFGDAADPPRIFSMRAGDDLATGGEKDLCVG